MHHPSTEGFSLPEPSSDSDPLQAVLNRLTQSIERDRLVQQTTQTLQAELQVDRVVLYYFYRRWKGQVTFETLSHPRFSILGSTGPDDCFNDEYAALYEADRVRAIEDILVEPIADCHRDFLANLQVRANLVVPVLPKHHLWGLLIAHNCTAPYVWNSEHLKAMRSAALELATAPVIQSSVI